MPVGTAIAIGTAALGLGQASYGWWQQRKGRKGLEDLERPGFTVPESVERSLSLAEQRRMEGLPTERMEAGARRTTAANVAAIREGARSPMEYIEGVTSSFRQELDEMNRIALQDVQYKLDASRDIERTLMERGRYEQREQEARYEDYGRKYNTYAGMQTAGVQNMWGGANTMVTAGTQWATQTMEAKQHEDWMALLERRFALDEADARSVFRAGSTPDVPLVSTPSNVPSGTQNNSWMFPPIGEMGSFERYIKSR